MLVRHRQRAVVLTKFSQNLFLTLWNQFFQKKCQATITKSQRSKNDETCFMRFRGGDSMENGGDSGKNRNLLRIASSSVMTLKTYAIIRSHGEIEI